jgi:hypothetical protein
MLKSRQGGKQPYMLRLFILMLFAFAGTAGAANCPPRPFSYPSDLLLDNPAVVIVTHASANYDPRYATKRGVDEAVSLARSKDMPVLYLENEETSESYFADDCSPDYRIFSEDGELPLDIRSTDIYVVGGHIELCLARTLQDVMASWSRHPERALRITFLMDGIYSNGKSLREKDPYYAAAHRFMGIVSHGRTERETWSKLTLLEALGIIEVSERRYEFLQRLVPQYEHVLSASYRVELQLNNEPPRVLRRGNPASGMRLQLRFVDSAENLKD